jgi:hypothetical protein
MSKVWRTQKPKENKFYKLSVKDIEIYRKNLSDVQQLISVAFNNMDIDNETIPGLKDQLTNSVVFLDDMRFMFGKLALADGVKIEQIKEGK